MTDTPYTRLIKDDIIKDLEKLDIDPKSVEMNPEFKAGAETMKTFIINSLKK